MKITRRGFTIVELVIVIVVIAILAAVLIPTFSSLTEKANASADEQLLRTMNTVLSAAEAEGEIPHHIGEVKHILYEAGINVYEYDIMHPKSKGHLFAWDPADNRIHLVKESDPLGELVDLAADYRPPVTSGNSPVVNKPYEDPPVACDDLAFTLDESTDTYVVSGLGNCNCKSLYIPSTHLGKPVTAIKDEAFSPTNLNFVSIPPSVNYIGKHAFKRVIALTEAVIHGDQVTVGEEAFSTTRLKKITFTGKSATLGDALFKGCALLTDVNFPRELERIGDNTFENCTNLQKIALPPALSYLGNNAFLGCSRLTEITLPSSLEYVGSNAFRGCSHLTEITLPPSVVFYGEYALRGSGIQRVHFPDGTVSIEKSCLDSCTNLTEVIIADTVTSIGDYAFSNCQKLAAVELPPNLETLGAGVFAGCKALRRIVLPEKITTLSGDTFSGCTSLEEVYIPASLTSLTPSAFDGCHNLTAFIIAENNPVYSLENNCLLEKKEGEITLIRGFDPTYRIYSDPQYYQNGSFTLDLSDFYQGCTVKSHVLYLPDGRRVYPNGIVETFLFDTSIGDVVSPGTLTQIQHHAIDKEGCITLDDGTVIDLKPLNACPFTDFTIPNGVTKIGENAFLDTKLDSRSVSFPDTVKSIGKQAFYGSSLTELHFNESSSLTRIEEKAFSGCPELKSFNCPKGVSHIGESAFSHCAALTSVIIPSDAPLTVINKEAFSSCAKLEGIALPSGLKAIGEKAFASCSSLRIISLPQSLETLQTYAFASCSSLESLTLPEGIDELSQSVFSHCSSLRKVTLPESITRIRVFAFINCRQMSEIHFGGTVAEWQSVIKEQDWNFLCPDGTVNCLDGSVATSGYSSGVDEPMAEPEVLDAL